MDGAERRGAREFVVALVLCGVVGLQGCASIVKGTTQSVTVNTDPTGANCVLSREGTQLTVVNPTPGTVQIGKASGAISVICRKQGFQDAAGTLASSFQAMTFGNIIFGGIIGVAVDAASGAMNEYPPMVTISLVPEEFASPAERDAYFEKLRAMLLQEADEVKQRIGKMCTQDCEAQLRAAEAGVPAKLDMIEQRRAQARVRNQ